MAIAAGELAGLGDAHPLRGSARRRGRRSPVRAGPSRQRWRCRGSWLHATTRAGGRSCRFRTSRSAQRPGQPAHALVERIRRRRGVGQAQERPGRLGREPWAAGEDDHALGRRGASPAPRRRCRRAAPPTGAGRRRGAWRAPAPAGGAAGRPRARRGARAARCAAAGGGAASPGRRRPPARPPAAGPRRRSRRRCARRAGALPPRRARRCRPRAGPGAADLVSERT